MQRRTKAHPETNTEQLGGDGRDAVKQQVTQNGIKIESDKPPPIPGVTRLPGQGVEGLRGLFKGTRDLRDGKNDSRFVVRPHYTHNARFG
jgi:hypothetical protein